MDAGQFIIDLRAIPLEGPRHFEFCLEKGWWHPEEEDDQIFGVSSPIISRVDIYKSGDKYVLEGDMAGVVSVRCDRCLGAYDHDIKTGFKLFFALPARSANKAEMELMEEDMETGFIDGETINLNDIFKEQLYLSLPIKSLCREDCPGLCPMCGADLNVEACRCKR
jgi:uncharacterized protein